MATRPDSLETTRLALEVLKRIPQRRKVTAAELHQQLQGVGITRDLRSIQRLLKMLSEHFDIECDDTTRPHGYRWREQAQGLAVPNLTAQQSLLLLLAEEHLRNLLPTPLMASMKGFFTQARRNLGPDTTAMHEREWPRKVRVVSITQPLLPPKVSPATFATVSEALYANRWLELDYRNFSGKQSTIEVMPLGLAQQGPRLYLVCRYKGYDNERSLALHRIQRAQASTLTFTRPKDFDLERYDDDGRFGFGEGQRIRLTFCMKTGVGGYLFESPLSADQEVRDIEGGYEISATVVDTAVLEWWLRGFGAGVWGVKKTPASSPD